MELRIEGISKSYYKNIGIFNKLPKENENRRKVIEVKKALKETSFMITEGIYGLMGPNGAGKTTLMNIIVGNLEPDTGALYLNGQDIQKMGSKFRERIGYMPQQQWMYENMSCMQFLTYMGALKAMSGKHAKDRIEEVLELVNLQSEKYKRIGSLSGGMKQRLLIAQAILNNPDILILDEPTAGVDPNERIRIRNLISEISFNKIVMIATHVVSDIEFISNEFILLKEGHLLYKEPYHKLVSLMDGKVMECMVDMEEVERFTKSHKVVSLMKEKEAVRIRIISDETVADYQSKLVEPTLEDLYLYLYGSET